MKKYFKILVLFAVFFTVNSFAYSHSVKEGDRGNHEGNLSLHHLSLREARNDSNVNYLPQTIIIKVKAQYRSVCTKNGINLSSLNKVLGSISAVNVKKKFPDHIPPPEARNKYGQTLIDLSLIYEIKYSAPVSIENAINLLYKDESIEYAEPHYIYKLSYVPNDPLKGNQWYLSAAFGPGSGSIQAFAAWDISQGDTNVVVGIVDTGIDIDHPDLINNIKYNYNDPINGIDDDGDGYTDNFRGWDLFGNDNNPQAVSNDHGVHVSGCASASTDNGIGVAAPGFNCKILPVRAGDGNSISQGYTGIVYAADHGADIINCSWGGQGGGSFAQDIITYATINKGALVVCAAGNDGADITHFPSGFEFAFSVASTNSNDIKSGFSNYGKTIDVCAPGSGIYSTGDGGIYYFSSGTSMASPVAAGSAALVKSVYPSYTGLQIGELLRVTSDNIDPLNLLIYKEKLGKGRINIYRALTENPPSIRMLNNSVTDGNNNIIETNDTIRIVGDFINYLNTSSANLSVKLSTTNGWVQILNDSSVLGQIAMLQTKTNTVDPFTVYIIPGAPEDLLVDFKLTYEDGSYTDFEYFSLRVNVTYIDVRENLVSTTVTSKGRLGYNDYSGQLQGLGFIYNSIVNDTVSNLLFEMGLMMATSSTQISNAVRIGGTADDDFVSVQNVSEVIPTQISDYDLAGAFNDNNAGASKLDVLVNYNTFAWKNAPNDKYVIVEYTIKNNGAATLNNMYLGLFADWDIMDFAQNRASWDTANNLGYAYSSQVNGLYGGIKLLTSGAPAYWAIDNDQAVAGNPWGIYDAYTDAEKYQSLSSAIGRTDAGIAGAGEDVSHVVGTGPFTLSVGDSVVVAFALIGGDSLQDIQNSAVAADIMYNIALLIPLPVVTNDTICYGTSATVIPSGATTYNWYDAFTGGTPFHSGATYTTSPLTADTTFYVSNADSVIESIRVPVTIVVRPMAFFSADPTTVNLSDTISFIDGSTGAVSWLWDFGDGSPTDNNQNTSHIYTIADTFNVTLTVTSSEGCTDTHVIQIIVIDLTGIQNHLLNEAVSLYPNPAKGIFTVRLDSKLLGSKLFIYNIYGKEVMRIESNNKIFNTIDMNGFGNGVYFVKVDSGWDMIFKKVVLLGSSEW